jgi:hypothetical protein
VTRLELESECARVRAVREECGLDPDTAMLVLVIPGNRKGERARVMSGLMGRVVGFRCDDSKPQTMVDVSVIDVERWLKGRP